MNGLSVVIPNWNGAERLKKSIPKLHRKLARLSCPSEIIVVDDASTDSSKEVLSRFSYIRLICNTRNEGFSRTANVGVWLAQYKIVFIMSNDILIEGSLDTLIAHFSDPLVFAVSPEVHWKTGGFAYGKRIARWEKGHFKVVEQPSLDHPVYTLFACGGSAAFDRSKFLELGGFDDLYRPFYWEEIDLSYRAWKRGYTVIHEPRTIVFNGSEGVIKEHFPARHIKHISGRNSYLFLWKNITSPDLIREHLNILVPSLCTEIIAGRFRFPLCFMAGLASVPKILARRKKELTLSVLSDHEVMNMVRLNIPVHDKVEITKHLHTEELTDNDYESCGYNTGSHGVGAVRR